MGTHQLERRLPRQVPAFASAADAEKSADFISAGVVAHAYGANEYTDFAGSVASGLRAAAKKAAGESLDSAAGEFGVKLDASKTPPLCVALPRWWGPSELQDDWTISIGNSEVSRSAG
jgi:hypothetical protein